MASASTSCSIVYRMVMRMQNVWLNHRELVGLVKVGKRWFRMGYHGIA